MYNIKLYVKRLVYCRWCVFKTLIRTISKVFIQGNCTGMPKKQTAFYVVFDASSSIMRRTTEPVGTIYGFFNVYIYVCVQQLRFNSFFMCICILKRNLPVYAF